MKGCMTGLRMLEALLSAEPMASPRQHQRLLWIWATSAPGTDISAEGCGCGSHGFAWQGLGNSHCDVFWLCRLAEMHSLDTQINENMLETIIFIHFIVNKWLSLLFWNKCCWVDTSRPHGELGQVTMATAGLKHHISYSSSVSCTLDSAALLSFYCSPFVLWQRRATGNSNSCWNM